jgi:hypothetical protein
LLIGDWRREHRFVLRQSRHMHQCYREQIAECDREIRWSIFPSFGAFPASQ